MSGIFGADHFEAEVPHGAAPNRLMVHLAMNEGDDQHDVVHWLQPVTDQEYTAAPPPLTERVHLTGFA